MRRTFFSVSVAFLLAAFSQNADCAPITVDTFDSPTPGSFFSPPASSPQAFTNTAPPGVILGTERNTTFTAISGNFVMGDGGFVGTDSTNVTAHPGAGALQFASGSAANVNLLYNGVGNTGLGGIDILTGNAGFEFNFLTLNSGKVTNDVAVSITINTAGGNLSFNGAFEEIFSPDSFSVPFTSFSGGPVSNLTNVNSISITLNSDNTTNVDFALDSIQITAIPEPTSMTLFGVCVFAGVSWLRRKAKHVSHG